MQVRKIVTTTTFTGRQIFVAGKLAVLLVGSRYDGNWRLLVEGSIQTFIRQF